MIPIPGIFGSTSNKSYVNVYFQYAVCMFVLAGANIALAVVIFRNLNGLINTVEEWINTAFVEHGQVENGPFRALEELVSIFKRPDHLNCVHEQSQFIEPFFAKP